MGVLLKLDPNDNDDTDEKYLGINLTKGYATEYYEYCFNN